MKIKLILLALAICLVGCEGSNLSEERKTNILSWKLKREKMKLDHLKELHRYKRMLEYQCRVYEVDSLILDFQTNYPIIYIEE